MTQEEQQQAFYDDLWKLRERYLNEFGLTFASFIGSIELFKLELWALHTDNSNVKNDASDPQ